MLHIYTFTPNKLWNAWIKNRKSTLKAYSQFNSNLQNIFLPFTNVEHDSFFLFRYFPTPNIPIIPSSNNWIQRFPYMPPMSKFIPNKPLSAWTKNRNSTLEACNKTKVKLRSPINRTLDPYHFSIQYANNAFFRLFESPLIY